MLSFTNLLILVLELRFFKILHFQNSYSGILSSNQQIWKTERSDIGLSWQFILSNLIFPVLVWLEIEYFDNIVESK